MLFQHKIFDQTDVIPDMKGKFQTQKTTIFKREKSNIHYKIPWKN